MHARTRAIGLIPAAGGRQVGANGDFQDTSGLVCQPNLCDVNVIANPASNADYSSCANKLTAEFCIPSCVPGYGTTNPASNITLVCNASGVFDGSNEIDCTYLNIATFTDGFETDMDGWTTGGRRCGCGVHGESVGRRAHIAVLPGGYAGQGVQAHFHIRAKVIK